MTRRGSTHRYTLLAVLAVLLLAAQGTWAEEEPPVRDRRCSSDEDCIPTGACHPEYCINDAAGDEWGRGGSVYGNESVCTAFFDCSAAYTASACLCGGNGICFNSNKDQGCAGSRPGQSVVIALVVTFALLVVLLAALIFVLCRKRKQPQNAEGSLDTVAA
eukprot:PLAT10008.1.p2 GENE.PLAT10008.1~~PLAT10008.1.p2  ORF type:complete len:161 (+),score=10.52 PLAT10008.1:92-574(+)